MNQFTSSTQKKERKGYSILHLGADDSGQISVRKDEIAILLAIKGQITYYWRSKVNLIEEGSGLMVTQSGIPKIFSLESNFEGILFTLEQTFVQKVLSLIRFQPGQDKNLISLSQLIIPRSESITTYLATLKLYAALADIDKEEPILESKLIELFWLLNNSKAKHEFDEFIYPFQLPSRTFLDTVLEKHFRENLSLNQLATIAGFSISTFKRKFEETYHCSPGKWIQNRRLMEARYLLEVTNKTISEICYEVGFENPSHFIQAFKQKFGSTPKRMQHSKKAA